MVTGVFHATVGSDAKVVAVGKHGVDRGRVRWETLRC